MSFTDFVVLPPGHGRSVTDFWGWDPHEARLRCPDDVSGDIGGCSARRALKPNFYKPTQTMVTARILPFREYSHGRTGNRTRDLMISSQRLWSLDHEAGRYLECSGLKILLQFRSKQRVSNWRSQDGSEQLIGHVEWLWMTAVFFCFAADPEITHGNSFVCNGLQLLCMWCVVSV